MINPYLLSAEDINKIRNAYNAVIKKQQDEDSRKMSLTHPYKTEEEVLRALQQENADINQVLSKMSPTLRKEQDIMLNLISQTEVAYLYVHQDINTQAFKQNALRHNPSVYDFLTDQDRLNPAISKAYLDGMVLQCTERRKIDATTPALQWKQQFSDKTNLEQVFTNERYEAAYRAIINNGPYETADDIGDNRVLSKDFLFVSTARLLRPDLHQQYDQLERQILNQHPNLIARLAYNDRNWKEADNALIAIETRCPEYKPLIAKTQNKYWEDRKQELIELQERQVKGELLSRQEQSIMQEGLKHVEIESRQQTTERIQKEREEELAYLKQDSIDRAYSAAANGDIEFSMAADTAAYIGNAPNKASSGVARAQLESVEAKENDIDNIDMDREKELERSAYDLDGDGDYDQDDRDLWNNLEERTEDEIYEQEYAGNPFVSYVPEEGLEPKYSYK